MPTAGVISDTHGYLPGAVHKLFEGVDCIVHAGDVCAPQVLWELESIAPVHAVLGNCDRHDLGPAVGFEASFAFGGMRVYVTHFPWDAEEAADGGEYGLVVHGHTHIPRDEMRGPCRIVNPGSSTRPRGGSEASVALVTVEDGAVVEVRHIAL